MAELNNNPKPTTGKKVRVRKMAPKVDLTAMVDLAFLLITFFMLTTSLNKPHSLDVAVPDKSDTFMPPTDIDERRVVSLIIDEGIFNWYRGDIANPLQAGDKDGTQLDDMREILLSLKDKVMKDTQGKDMIVLIKPTQNSRTQDIINTLDEMKITNIKRYMISKTNNLEENILANR